MKGLEYALSTLKDREREITLLRYREHCTYNQIALEIDKSKDRVRQIILKSLGKLRQPNRAEYISEGYGVEIPDTYGFVYDEEHPYIGRYGVKEYK